ncbi:unnamed protein product [Adineta ricciae]|uniref:Uncharacterized protein n=1 Tax=Adineta ricciae TaxID=249248 RepID=A0A813T9I4_ADIRI|nr:unnamed protein product [Adineta ricciae]CAF0808338.1 unnamed protein product [Adineta ricciae]
MPIDMSENSISPAPITMITDANNAESSSSLTTTITLNNDKSPPLSFTVQNTPRPNSPIQTLSKQLDKLRRFLSTLYYFGTDISNEIGERVRILITALVNNALSVEEFHAKLQATTNFPLRPFALPFLKSTLPILQKEMSELARQSKQSVSQYIVQNEELIFLSRDILENELSPPKEPINENGKRKFSDDLNEVEERPYATKRAVVNHRMYQNTIRRDKDRSFSSYLREYTNDHKDSDDEWKNAENMLNCILEMVTKSKRVLFVLQQKDIHLRRLIETNELEWRRRHAELLTQTDDRISEIRRKAEETVLEIKRQSIIDLQKAVTQSEQKSNDLLLREREQYQRLKAQTFEEAYTLLNRQQDGPEHCWHCGRKAIETCSGCNVARYCGQFCQHRDWESHQKLCGADLKRKLHDNPHLHYRSSPKTTSSNLPKDDSIIPTILNASSSPVKDNTNERSEGNNDEIPLVKSESN